MYLQNMWQFLKDVILALFKYVDSKPTKREMEILRHAVDHPCGITVLEVDGHGRWVRSGDVDLPSDNDKRLSAEYLDALDGLNRKGYVRQETIAFGSQLETYSLTGSGYKALDSI